ncbi:hypothetical protein AB7C87_00365 [Natrarchaeobius sp. A-rgal3]|uniref:hypothetical protein n=1 Tax=Natrarchaeobius versutus TaxID=1679078 RepID=UPI0035104F13
MTEPLRGCSRRSYLRRVGATGVGSGTAGLAGCGRENRNDERGNPGGNGGGGGETDGDPSIGYVTSVPPTVDRPPREPSVTDSVDGPLQSNDWWTSALFDRFSEPLFAHPFVAQATEDGLAVARPVSWEASGSYDVTENVT